MDTTELLAPIDKSSLAHSAEAWTDRARAVQITDAASCQQAGFLLKSIKGVRADIQRWFAPHVEAAMETKRKAEWARKGLVDEQDRMEAPLVTAETTIKRALLVYEAADETKRREEEQRLQREVQARAEAVTLEAAAALETEAVRTGDVELRQEAEDILSQPIDAPIVHVKTTVPKVEGISYRDNWKPHPEIDVKALAGAVFRGDAPVSFLQASMTPINAWARLTQGAAKIAGIRVFNDRQIAARR